MKAYPAARFHGRCDEGVRADYRIVSDDSLAAEYRSSGIDGDPVLDGRMTLLALQALAAAG